MIRHAGVQESGCFSSLDALSLGALLEGHRESKQLVQQLKSHVFRVASQQCPATFSASVLQREVLHWHVPAALPRRHRRALRCGGRVLQRLLPGQQVCRLHWQWSGVR